MPQELFHIAPMAQRSGWLAIGFPVFIVVMSVFFIAAMAFAWKSVTAAEKTTFLVDERGLAIRSFPYSRTLAWSELVLDEAAIVDLREGSPYRPRRRTAGTSMGQLRAGWFRTADNSKALLFLTRPDQAVMIPTRKGHLLLLSVEEPARFLESLRRAAAV